MITAKHNIHMSHTVYQTLHDVWKIKKFPWNWTQTFTFFPVEKHHSNRRRTADMYIYFIFRFFSFFIFLFRFSVEKMIWGNIVYYKSSLSVENHLPKQSGFSTFIIIYNEKNTDTRALTLILICEKFIITKYWESTEHQPAQSTHWSLTESLCYFSLYK